MNIGLIGSGGREHALCKKVYESKLAHNIVCFPGNAGTSKLATNVEVDILDFKKILKLIRFHNIDLVIIGPEEPLVNGMVDYLKKNKIKVFGPNKYAAKLEGSKAFMKMICIKNKIPTAKFKICNEMKQVKKFLNNCKLPLVVKADGLAAGKGVSICKSKKQVVKETSDIFKGKFKTSKKVVLEEFLKGEEVSYFVIVDKKSFKFFGTAQDHKRVYENDKGPNTGGMGAYSPAPIVSKGLETKIISKIIKPTLKALKNKKKPYTGFLYVGLMIKNNEPYLIEYNIRMGDPECQVILPRLKTDIVKIFRYAILNKLEKIKINWKKQKSMTIVLCAKGYPGAYKKNLIINNINKIKLSKKDSIYHAGTKLLNGEVRSNGGRVLNVSSIGDNFLKIRERIILNIKKLNVKNSFYRKDIGWKVISKNENY
ncbi:phosphoribosylamine--glycine ligase [Candidatus Pelagibacter bacterium]|nr:phosphoribosylamine--glycine ligase [Candidatus Pelagibacter bacterium]MDA9619025.1 phosphoribosylamine--glycine ligase [Candidatus Pelagibacter bacterium]